MADTQVLSLRVFGRHFLGGPLHPAEGKIPDVVDFNTTSDYSETDPRFGFHAFAWGVGVEILDRWILWRHGEDVVWQVLSSPTSGVAGSHDLVGHIRVGSADVVHTGDRWSAGQYLLASGLLPTDSSPYGLAPFAVVTAHGATDAVAGPFGTASVADGLAAADFGGNLVFRDAGVSFPVSLPFRTSHQWRLLVSPERAKWAGYPPREPHLTPHGDGPSIPVALEPHVLYALVDGVPQPRKRWINGQVVDYEPWPIWATAYRQPVVTRDVPSAEQQVAAARDAMMRRRLRGHVTSVSEP